MPWVRLAGWTLGLGAGWSALVLASASWPAAAAWQHSRAWHPLAYTEQWAARTCTAFEYQATRWGLAGLALGGVGLLLVSRAWRPAAGPAGRARVRRWRRHLRAWAAPWRALSARQLALAGAALGLLSGLRLAVSGLAQPLDDLTSYELFVRGRLLVVSAFYPVPNNHVLANTLAWGVQQLHPGFWWAMRLPVLLTATVATVAWHRLLLRRTGSAGVALAAVAGFAVLADSLYYAAVGRGYWLLLLLSAVGAGAVLRLEWPPAGAWSGLTRPAARRAALALVLGGCAGLYAVPTHAYCLAGLYGWLGWRALASRAPVRRLVELAGLGLLTLLGAALLYAPLLLLSGPSWLLHNQFVEALSGPALAAELGAWLRQPHNLVSVPVRGLVLVGMGWAWLRAGWPAVSRALAGLLLALALSPVPVALLQRLVPPERALLLSDLAWCALAALVLAVVVRRLAGRFPAVARARTRYRALAARWPGLAEVGLPLLGLLGLVAPQLALLAWREQQWARAWPWRQAAPVAAWLAARPPGPVLAPDAVSQLTLGFYAHEQVPGRPWHIDTAPRPGVRYRYYVRRTNGRAADEGPAVAGPPAFANDFLQVYELPAQR